MSISMNTANSYNLTHSLSLSQAHPEPLPFLTTHQYADMCIHSLLFPGYLLNAFYDFQMPLNVAKGQMFHYLHPENPRPSHIQALRIRFGYIFNYCIQTGNLFTPCLINEQSSSFCLIHQNKFLTRLPLPSIFSVPKYDGNSNVIQDLFPYY